MFKLLIILFVIKLYARKNISKKNPFKRLIDTSCPFQMTDKV